ncbi:MAG TPA: PAS domain-containing protein [Vicinamibacterales bacterium]|nr:PAS domain-containing protein [Vicinamibacterales bacterium]
MQLTSTANWTELLMADHETTERVFDAVERALRDPAPSRGLLSDALEYFTGYVARCHSHKEEDHLFPLLESRGMRLDAGPLAVMLMEHQRSEELLSSLGSLVGEYVAGRDAVLPDLRQTFSQYAAVLKDHFWKENDILFPMARHMLGAADAARVVAGIAAVESAIGPDTRARYFDLARRIIEGGEVRDLSANLSPEVLAAMLNTLPLELSFVDADDRVRYFSHEHQPKIFPRSRGAIGRAVQQCHPPKSVDKVNLILASFKAGQRDVAEFWLDMRGRKVHVRYFAVRSPDGRYLGTLETVQDIAPLQQLTGERRLIDEAMAAG